MCVCVCVRVRVHISMGLRCCEAGSHRARPVRVNLVEDEINISIGVDFRGEAEITHGLAELLPVDRMVAPLVLFSRETMEAASQRRAKPHGSRVCRPLPKGWA